MTDEKTTGQKAADAAGFIVPAPFVVWLFGVLGVPMDPVTAAGIGAALTWAGSLIMKKIRKEKA